MNSSPAKFAEALDRIEALGIDDPAALLEIANKRLAAARRREIIQEVGEARADYARGKVKLGSAATLMRQLRAK